MKVKQLQAGYQEGKYNDPSEYNYFWYSLLLYKFSRHCELLDWWTLFASSLSRGVAFLVFVRVILFAIINKSTISNKRSTSEK